ncbi:PqiB family protein [Roseicitreum antarcticum]|uniref:Paraquat-inducible protein B n=1 Tax=Roseicitreum antarcticum TaxID=564137 RepID=A0A1H3CDS4_9RHOB|nr:MlaD family protein [Roseicitreum antarcticum]SDX52170.1 paraquat-inducible protein B [Roseicitreum antarcticum]
MSDTQDPAPLDIRPAKRPLRERFSLVWAVPVLALIVSLGVAFKAYTDRGQLIEIAFPDAAGIVAGQTPLRFREVAVGMVETVRFSDDLTEVIVGVRVDNDVAPLIGEEAQFWLVQPEVSARGISRLDTVLSGSFIEGLWDAEIGERQPLYRALDRAPVARFVGGGSVVQLRTADAGGVSEGAPVLFRGLEVGELFNLRLDPAGTGALIDAFIRAPYDARLTSGTRFWDISGFSVSVGGSGLSLDVRSIASLITGGVEFSDIISGGVPVEAGQQYRLFDDEAAARDAILLDDADNFVPVSLLVDGSVQGLEVGADVTYRGLRVGRVNDFAVVVQSGVRGSREVRLQLNMTLQPARLGLRADTSYAETLGFLQERVGLGMRGRIASTGLFGTTLEVQLIEFDDIEPGVIDFRHEPFPLLPAAPSEIIDAGATAEGLLTRVGNLPIEELMQSAIRLLNAGTDLVGRDSTQQVPERLVSVLDSVALLVASEDVQAIPADARAALREFASILEEFRDAGLPDQISILVDDTASAIRAVDLAAESVPPLLQELEELARGVRTLPLDALARRADELLLTLDGLFGSEETAALPGALTDTLVELRQSLTELRDGGAVESLNLALGSARDAADAVADSAAQLPALLQRLDTVVQSVDGAVATYGARSAFNEETVAALREIRRAAAAAGSLARTLERNPNSLILGR